MNDELKNYLDEIYGKQFDDENWIYYDDENQIITIENVCGGNEKWDLNSSEIQHAINGNQGDTKKALIKIKHLLN